VTETPRESRPAARFITNAFNPFFVFTALYLGVALAYVSPSRAVVYVAVELAAAGFVAGYVLLMRRRSRVSDFWISTRAQRIVPAFFLLGAFVAILVGLYLLDAPSQLFDLTLSMGLASATVAAVTLLWKASAHCAVAGHAAVAGPLLLGPAGILFTLALLPVLYARVSPEAHTVAQALAGIGVGAFFAAAFLLI
jgi:hypothetical protein